MQHFAHMPLELPDGVKVARPIVLTCKPWGSCSLPGVLTAPAATCAAACEAAPSRAEGGAAGDVDAAMI